MQRGNQFLNSEVYLEINDYRLLIVSYVFSAHTSKRVAKVIIVFIWVLAFSLAAPMAMSWEVIEEDEQDPRKSLFTNKMFQPTELGFRLLTA